MLVLPIVNRNRVLNVQVKLKNAEKVREGVKLKGFMPSDVVVNGKSFTEAQRDSREMADFIRNNSLVYKRPVYITTKDSKGSEVYDVYEAPLPSKRVTDGLDALYIGNLLDMQKEVPNDKRGRYVALKDFGLDDLFSDRNIAKVKNIVTNTRSSDEWDLLFREEKVDGLFRALDFMNSFDCTVISDSGIDESVLQQVISSFDILRTRDTKSLNRYYNIALDNRDIYAKMSYVNNLVYGKPLTLIGSQAQKNRQLVKIDEREKKEVA